jgi:putative toxin-antitoxin system antitoxin component (TIGR02293 family)
MAVRKKPNGRGAPGGRVEFFAESGRGVSFLNLPAAGGRIRVSVTSPRLVSFLIDELTPMGVMRGVGLGLTTETPVSEVIEAGIPASVVRDFAAASGLALGDVGVVVGTSDRTMSRKIANGERLDAAESDRAYRLFEVVARTVHAFGDVAKAQRWLQRAIPSLGGRKPIDLLRTEIGTREVFSALDRLEYGGVA